MADDFTNPYVGLRPFEEGDRNRFFGRTGVAADILARLEAKRLSVVTGESGAGKRSVVRAAVIPEWRAKHPGGEVSLLRAEARRESWRPCAGEDPVLPRLLVVDAFEELFVSACSAAEDGERAGRFVASLVEALQGPEKVQVLLVIRDDFLGDLRRFPDLAARADAALCRVLPPAKAEWREMILAPARSQGVTFESGLVSTMLDDLHRGGEGMLPLLQYLLHRLWEEARREGLEKGGKIRTATYRAVGGVRQALARGTARVFGSGSQAERQRLRAMLMSTVRFCESRGQIRAMALPVSRLTLVARGGIRSGALLEVLVREGFLRTCQSGEGMELGHEILMSESRDFAGWMVEAREAGELRLALSQSAERWLELRRRWRFWRARAQLWSGGRLLRALEFHKGERGALPGEVEFGQTGPLNRVQEEFLRAACRVFRDQKRRFWVLAGGLVAVTLAALGLAWRALWLMQAAEQEEKSVRVAAGTGWLARARMAAEQGRGVESGFLAGFATGFTGAGREQPASPPGRLERASASPVWLVREASRGVETIRERWPGAAKYFGMRSPGERLFPPLLTPEEAPEKFRDALARMAEAPRPFVWSSPIQEGAVPVHCAAFDPEGRILASGSRDGAVKLWEVASGREVARLSGLTAAVRGLAFDPAGTLLAACSGDGAVRLWELASRELRVSLPPGQEWGNWIGFQADGGLLRSGSNGRVSVWNAVSGRMVHTVVVPASRCFALAGSGGVLGIGGAGGAIHLWNPLAGSETEKLAGHSKEVSSLAFRSDGALLVSGDERGTLKCWDVRRRAERWVVSVPGAAVQGLAIDSRGERVAGALADGTVRVWEAGQGKAACVFAGHSGPVNSVDFSPDGSILLSASEDGTLKFWILDGQRPFGWFRYVREEWVQWDEMREGLVWRQNPAGLALLEQDIPPDGWLGMLRQPSGPGQARRLLSAALAARNWQAAVLLADGGTESGEGVEWLIREVVSAQNAGDSALAELRMRQGDRLFPGNPDWGMLRGTWFEKNGERREALVRYREVDDARGWRGVARLTEGKEAMAFWRRVLGSNGEKLTAADFRNAGTEAAALGQREEARKLFRQGIERFGSDAALRVSFGKSLSRWGELDVAREHLERGVAILETGGPGALENGLPAAVSELALVLVRLGRMEDAWEAYQRPLRGLGDGQGQPAPGSSGAGQGRVELLAGAVYLGMLLGRSEEAETILAEAKDRADGPEQRALVLERHGWGLLAQGRALEAYREFGQAVAECGFHERDAAETSSELLAGTAAAGWLAGFREAALNEFGALVQRGDGNQWLQPGHLEELSHLPRTGVEALRAVLEAWREREHRRGNAGRGN